MIKRKLAYTKKQICMMVIGILLSVISIALSYCDSVASSSFNGWTGEYSGGVGGFGEGVVLWIGLIEIVLFFFRKTPFRILGVVVSLVKLVLPWLGHIAMQGLSGVSIDAMFEYEMVNAVPYIFTVVAVLSVVHAIVMAAIYAADRKKSVSIA